jgi:hypothetical protein
LPPPPPHSPAPREAFCAGARGCAPSPVFSRGIGKWAHVVFLFAPRHAPCQIHVHFYHICVRTRVRLHTHTPCVHTCCCSGTVTPGLRTSPAPPSLFPCSTPPLVQHCLCVCVALARTHTHTHTHTEVHARQHVHAGSQNLDNQMQVRWRRRRRNPTLVPHTHTKRAAKARGGVLFTTHHIGNKRS